MAELDRMAKIRSRKEKIRQENFPIVYLGLMSSFSPKQRPDLAAKTWDTLNRESHNAAAAAFGSL